MKHNEIWLPVVGYEGYYEISNLGRLRSVDRIVNHPKGGVVLINGIRIKTFSDPDGYPVGKMSKLDKRRFVRIHRLVATAFIPNPENKPSVNHINCIRWDNRASNLEWCTQQENVAYATKLGRMKGGRKRKQTS